MRTTAREVLKAFDSLPLPEQQQVAVEILRCTVGDGDACQARAG
jgi:hypothetical protein